MIRHEDVKSIPYDGYNIGSSELACCLTPKENFSRSGLTYHEERDRSLLDVALLVAFQLGIEQGRRMTKEEYGPLLKSFERHLKTL